MDQIDNNADERALRGVGLGRRNYLFFDWDASGERAAAIDSLVETAKLNGLDPEAFLREVFERIAAQPGLLPNHWYGGLGQVTRRSAASARCGHRRGLRE